MNLKVSLSDKQWECIEAVNRYILFSTGIGYGKTVAGCYWTAIRAINHPGANCLIAARDYGQLRDAVNKEFRSCLEKLGFREERDYVFNKALLHYKFFNGSEVQLRSSKNYDSAFRASSYQFIWFDEAEFVDPEAYYTIDGRLRGGQAIGCKEQMLITSSPNGFGHVYQHFYKSEETDKKIIFAPTTESPWATDAYIRSKRALLSPKRYRQEVLAERLNVANQPVYDEFEFKKNVTECANSLRDTDQLYAFLDYNPGRYPCIFMFIRGQTVYAIREIFLEEGGTRRMADRITQSFPERHITIIGDSSGNNKRDVAADKTNYQIFDEYAYLHPTHFHNPRREARINGVNSHLFHRRVVVDPSCKRLIADLEKVSYDINGQVDQKTDTDLTHMSDAFGYGLWHFLPLEKKRTPKKPISI